MRSLHQQRPQICVAFFADSQFRPALARLPALGPQPHIATHRATLSEAMWIFHCQHECQRDQCPHAMDLLQQIHFRIRSNGSEQLEYIVAGNMPVLHYRRSQNDVVRLAMEQFPLGLWPAANYSSGHVTCATGDVFAIFTDGLVETMDAWHQEFGLHRMERILRESASGSLAEIYEAAIDAVARHGEQSDDRTLMLVRVLALNWR